MIQITKAQEQVLESARDKWGEYSQFMMSIEEMAELSNAIIKKMRNRASIDEVAEEVADVFIMMQGLNTCIGNDIVQNFVDKKMDRLKMRIASEK